MNILPNQIIQKINDEFALKYKPFGIFMNSGELWDLCILTIKDVDLVNKIIFCNDILKIPPVKVFLLVNKSDFAISDYERKCIGAFWGFIFKFVFLYSNQKSTSISTKGIKTATYFYDVEDTVKIVNEV